MLKFFLFLFCLIYCISFSQRMVIDSLSEEDCDKQRLYNEREYNDLKNDFEGVNFSKLSQKIINDLDKSKFKTEYINYYYRVSLNLPRDLYTGYECYLEYDLKSPFYNRSNWSGYEISLLSKKFNGKFIVPCYIDLENGIQYVTSKDSRFQNLKKARFKTKPIYFASTSNKEFHYDERKKVTVLWFDFVNQNNKTILVDIHINKSIIKKAYQFQYGTWKKIKVDNND